MSSISRYRLAAWNHRIDNDMITNQIEASIHLNAHQPMESPCHAASPAPPAVFCSTSMGRGHYSLLSAADSADEQGGGAALMFLNDAANELFITSAAVSFGNDTNRYSQVVTDDDIKDFSSQMMTNKPHKTQVIGAILESSAAGENILDKHILASIDAFGCLLFLCYYRVSLYWSFAIERRGRYYYKPYIFLRNV